MIDIELDSEWSRFLDLFGLQNLCCFCRKNTSYWTLHPSRKSNKQVPCCEDCAKIVEYNHLPTVKHYLKREDILFELESLK